MSNRLRLLQAATALLYIGPLLAGLAGQGWAMVPLFAALFVVWSVILRPHLWPASPADFAKAEAAVAVASLVATQVLLVTLCFSIGLGLAGVTGQHLALPLYLPAALSFLSIPLSRLVWNPSRVESLAGLDPLTLRPSPDTLPSATLPATTDLASADLAATMVAQVTALQNDAGEAEIQSHLTAIATHVDAVLIRRALQNAIRDHRTHAGLKALIVHATDPDVAELLLGSAYPSEAFTMAGTDDDLLTLFATRCARALRDEPLLAPDCPTAAAVTHAGETAGTEARSALLRLAGLLS